MRYRGGLRNPLLINFRVDVEGYEYLARKCYNKSIAEETRKRWFPPSWKTELKQLRLRQRHEGIPDMNFAHPAQKKLRNGSRAKR